MNWVCLLGITMMSLLVVIPTNEWFSLPVRNHDKTKIRNNYTMTCYCLRKKRKKEKNVNGFENQNGLNMTLQ